MLGLRREMADAHVLDHAPAKWGDAFLGHAILLSEARLLTPRSSDRTLPPRYRTPTMTPPSRREDALPRGRFNSLARLGPAVRSAIRSLCDGKRTLRTPYSTSSIYEC